MLKNWCKEERGSMMIDGMIAMLITIMILVFLMSLGFLLYQQWMVSNVANDTATRLAQRYPYTSADIITGQTALEDMNGLPLYRYLGSRLERENGARGESFALDTLAMAGLATPVRNPEIDVKECYDSLGRRHVEVHITAEYEVPLGGALQYFGMDQTVTYQATGRAVCMDMLEYINSVEAVDSISTTLGADGAVDGAVDGLMTAVRKIIDLFR